MGKRDIIEMIKSTCGHQITIETAQEVFEKVKKALEGKKCDFCEVPCNQKWCSTNEQD